MGSGETTRVGLSHTPFLAFGTDLYRFPSVSGVGVPDRETDPLVTHGAV